MAIRLIAASLGVAGLAYVTSPLLALISFLVLVAGPVTYSAYVQERPSIVPPQ